MGADSVTSPLAIEPRQSERTGRHHMMQAHIPALLLVSHKAQAETHRMSVKIKLIPSIWHMVGKSKRLFSAFNMETLQILVNREPTC